jgi:cytochrome c553
MLSLGGLIVLAVGGLYAASEWMFAVTYEPPVITLRTQQPASAERGQRLAMTFGCLGCHGTHGRILFEAPFVARMVTSDLPRVQKTYSDAELVTLLRTGIKRDHTSAIQMPTNALSSLADTDLADIIAWLRTLTPDAETESATTTIGPVGRALLLTGAINLSATMPRDPEPPAIVPDGPVLRGEYLVKVACTDCHRLEQPHNIKPGLVAPPLLEMARAYDLGQFKHLMRDGKGAGDRELQLMSEVAREGFSHFTDDEIAAIYAYLNYNP